MWKKKKKRKAKIYYYYYFQIVQIIIFDRLLELIDIWYLISRDECTRIEREGRRRARGRISKIAPPLHRSLRGNFDTGNESRRRHPGRNRADNRDGARYVTPGVSTFTDLAPWRGVRVKRRVVWIFARLLLSRVHDQILSPSMPSRL